MLLVSTVTSRKATRSFNNASISEKFPLSESISVLICNSVVWNKHFFKEKAET